MQASQAIKDKRKKGEGLSLVAYLDPPHNTRGLYSIGYGHQIQPNERSLLTKKLTQAEANLMFDADCRIKENAVNASAKRPLTQNQFDALFEFAYNCGTGAMDHIAQIWNSTGDSTLVVAHIKAYDHVTISENPKVTKVDPELTRLRNYEAGLFQGGVAAVAAVVGEKKT